MTNLSRSAALAGFAEIVRAAGGDPYKFAAAAGVPAKALSDLDMLIPTAALRTLIERAGEQLNMEDLGLRMAERRRLSNWGALGLAVRDQATLRKALEVMQRYLWVQTESFTLNLEEAGEIAIVHVQAAAWQPGWQSAELALAAIFLNLRTLMGESWRALEVRFIHRRPAKIDTALRIFGIEPQYGQDFLGLVIRRRDLDTPREDADPVMARQAIRFLEDIAARRGGSFRDNVRDEIGRILASGACTVERMAEQMGIDRRTLHRRLAAEETSFTALVEDVRAERAEVLLSDPERTVQRIAEELGFSGMSAFAHWFRRRFGRSATAYRNRKGEADLGSVAP